MVQAEGSPGGKSLSWKLELEQTLGRPISVFSPSLVCCTKAVKSALSSALGVNCSAYKYKFNMYLGGGEFGVFPCHHLRVGACNQKILTDTHPIWGRQRKKRLILHVGLVFKQKEVECKKTRRAFGV